MNRNPAAGRAGKISGLVVAGLFAAVGVGAAVAMVVTGARVHGGKASAQALVEATVAAWTAGDGNRAVSLMPSYDELAAAVDCPRVDDEPGRARHQRQRTEVWARSQVWKPRRPHLRQVEPGAVTAVAVDEEVGQCVAKVPFALQLLDVTVELDGRGHGEQEVTLTAVQLGTRWYLMDVGTLPAGLEDQHRVLLAGRRAREEYRRKGRPDYDLDLDFDLDDDEDDEDEGASDSLWVALGGPSTSALRSLREFRDRTCACKDLACVDKVQAELAAFSIKLEDTQPAITDQDAAMKLGLEMTECTNKLRSVPACDAYVTIVEWYMQCDAIPQAARDGMKQGIDAMRQGWSAANLPDSARQAMDDSCRAAVDAMRQAGDAMGCAPPPP